MGGSIRTVFIKDGQVYKQTRWTNGLPLFVKHDKFIEKNEEWINDYINQPSGYREEHETFSPSGYGLDIFDFDRKKIYSHQIYCNYDTIHYANIAIFLGKHASDIDDPDYNYSEVTKRMWEKKMLTTKITYINSLKKEIGKHTYEKALEMGKDYFLKLTLKERKYVEFIINWGDFGWELREYDNLRLYLEDVKKVYTLTQEDLDVWEETIKENEDDDNLD